MTYWYIIWSPGGAIIANKSLCLKDDESCSEKILKFRVRSTNFFAKKYADRTRIGPEIFQKTYSLCVQRWGGLESRAAGGYTWNLILFHMVKLIRSYIK